MAVPEALRLLLAALLLLPLPGPSAAATPPAAPPAPPARLLCELLAAAGGGRLPGAGASRPALLRLRGDTDGDSGDSGDSDTEFALVLDVSDPGGAVLALAAGGAAGAPPQCELSPTAPGGGAAPWARALAPQRRSPPALAGAWWAVAAAAPPLAVGALLQAPPPAPGDRAVAAATVVLAVFSRTPAVTWRGGDAGTLHCAFAGPPGPFAVEWRHQHRGAGRVLLAYDSVAARAPVALPGAELLLGTPEGDDDGGVAVTEVSLRLRPLGPAREGAYVCTVYLPHFHAQQVLQVRVLEPPKVTLLPNPLVVAPGVAAELLCAVSGYYPLDVTVTWQRRAGDAGDVPLPLGDTWTSGHRLGPNGTFSRHSGARLAPARPHHHGDTYACVVAHAALAEPLRVTVRLQVAGVAGPGLEDAVGLFLVAFVLYSLIRWLDGSALHPPPRDSGQKSE